MHIPENYLSPSTCAVMAAAMVPVWTYSVKKVKEEIPKVKMPLLGIGAAFSFLGMMFNIPLPGGTTGHAVGGTLICDSYGKSVGRLYCRYDRTAYPGIVVWRWRYSRFWSKLF